MGLYKEPGSTQPKELSFGKKDVLCCFIAFFGYHRKPLFFCFLSFNYMYNQKGCEGDSTGYQNFFGFHAMSILKNLVQQ